MNLFQRKPPEKLSDAELDARGQRLQKRSRYIPAGIIATTLLEGVVIVGSMCALMSPTFPAALAGYAFGAFVSGIASVIGTIIFVESSLNELDTLKAEKKRRVEATQFSPPPPVKVAPSISGTFEATVTTGQTIKVKPLKLNIPMPGPG